jgi:hypothetical protein
MATSAKDNEDLKVISPIGTAAFPHLFTPHSFEAGKEPNYSLILCFPEGTDLKELKKACARAAAKKFGDMEKVKAMLAKGQLRMPWRDGGDYAEYGEPFVPGSTFITIKSKQAPGVVNERAKPVMNEMDFYAGCMARASFLCWGYDSMGNKGVTLLLNNVQKTGDGTRLSGRQSAETEFEPVKGSGGKAAADLDDDDIPF